jgi:hypothetical protein
MVLLCLKMCHYATDRENIFLCSVLNLFHIRAIFLKLILQFFKSKKCLVRYIVAYHKKMYFELGLFDWVKTHICYSMHYIDSVFQNSCSIIKLNYLCNKYEYCKYEGVLISP